MNSTKKERKVSVHFRLEKDQLDLIDGIVAKKSSTRSEVMRKLLESALVEYIKKTTPKQEKKMQLTPREFLGDFRSGEEVVILQIDEKNELL